ncbi:MAG: glycyl-radical enzyme activating protein [Oscillospiraceae bacterium]|jgi:pyruvate formate lyase activating enzyme|nr:glycyl-radical enzyme activating protein [Oscillospiraceae bacterium]
MSTVTILDLQRMSSEDGPGLRTTVFLKGCPLACKWCHNPESIAFRGEVLWHGQRCIGCKECVRECPQRGVRFEGTGLTIARERCEGCFACCEQCPAGALEAKGRVVEAAALCRELLKDRAYFGAEGGVTLSGGEALMQESAMELLQLLRAQKAAAGQPDFNIAIDTCGLVPAERLQRALLLCDIVLFDVKIADTRAHREHTGAGNEEILQSLRTVGAWAVQVGGRLWVRTPIIPGATDHEENIAAIGKLLSELPAGSVERWELCAFNNLCASKYASLEQEWAYAAVPLMRRADMERLTAIAQQARACGHTRWTGAVRREE